MLVNTTDYRTDKNQALCKAIIINAGQPVPEVCFSWAHTSYFSGQTVSALALAEKDAAQRDIYLYDYDAKIGAILSKGKKS